ncbi:transferase [Pseudodesulfovibrio cashew]|uniref:Transferase n=1 Tax=Pseudodesulfovibrio cashew TaxID=2678688 RepID=A0A6I6JI62_9BACT|nr:transferase [Pseudodesulfovibrio cashew]QGY40879.1 transferase [Pseudodesulfovibrio cashew]
MRFAQSVDDIKELVVRQLENMWCVDRKKNSTQLFQAVDVTIKRCERCFRDCVSKHLVEDGEPIFNTEYSNLYCIFLYYLSNSLYEEFENASLAARVYQLNKALHGVDMFYEVKLPDVFHLSHPLGSVLGRATYSDYFFFIQNVTVGGNRGRYPVFGKNVTLWSGVTVIGDTHIGKNCIISSRSFLKDEVIPDNSLVFGRSPNIVIKTKEESYFLNKNHFNTKSLH